MVSDTCSNEYLEYYHLPILWGYYMTVPAEYLIPILLMCEDLLQVFLFIREYLNLQRVWIHVRLQRYYCHSEKLYTSSGDMQA